MARGLEDVLAPILGGVQAVRLIRELSALAGGVFFVVDRTWSVVHWDDAAARELRVSAADALNGHCLKVVQCAVCLGGCAMIVSGRPETVQVRRADGSHGWYRRRVYPGFDDDGAFRGGVEVLVPAVPPADRAAEVAGIATSDPQLQEALRTAIRLAPGRLPLHLETRDPDLALAVARAVHRVGGSGTFLVVDAASLQAYDLLGGEPCPDCGTPLRPRLAQDAATVLLDDVVSAPRALQPALQRLIGHEWSCGAGCRVRFVTSARTPLDEAVRAGRLQPRLADLLAVCRLALAGLAERPADLDLLIRHTLDGLDGGARQVSPEAMVLLRGHPWRGGAAELRLALEWAAGHAAGATIRPDDLPLALRLGSRAPSEPADEGLARAEAQRLRQALEQEDGNLTRTAARLGISRATLWRRRRKYGV